MERRQPPFDHRKNSSSERNQHSIGAASDPVAPHATDPYGQNTPLAPTSYADLKWSYFYQDLPCDSVADVYEHRNRARSPILTRWLQQEPLAYVELKSAHQYPALP